MRQPKQTQTTPFSNTRSTALGSDTSVIQRAPPLRAKWTEARIHKAVSYSFLTRWLGPIANTCDGSECMNTRLTAPLTPSSIQSDGLHCGLPMTVSLLPWHICDTPSHLQQIQCNIKTGNQEGGGGITGVGFKPNFTSFTVPRLFA